MDFAYQYSFGRPWNDFDDPIYRDHMFTYPTKNGVVGTLAWEGYREAHDDNRYIATLEAAIASGAASGDPSRRAAAADAQRYLDNLRTTVLSGIGKGEQTADFPMDLYAMRKALADYISAIGISKKAKHRK
jgi:hypothetical protein